DASGAGGGPSLVAGAFVGAAAGIGRGGAATGDDDASTANGPPAAGAPDGASTVPSARVSGSGSHVDWSSTTSMMAASADSRSGSGRSIAATGAVSRSGGS